jgi:predicted DNA-binding transcriptional regulator YafY
MANKSRVLYLLRYLCQYSDEDHPVTTAEIRQELAEKSCPATVETLRDDILMLRESGFDILINESNGRSTTYAWVDRAFDTAELQILIDAVASARFIPLSKTQNLIRKLSDMAGPSHAEEIRPAVLSAEFIKTKDPQFLYIIEKIREGIQRKRKIAYQYFEYDLEKNRVPRHGGEEYIVSPYAMIWRYDRYFLIGRSDKREKISVYRVDRMGLPRITGDEIVPPPVTFNIRDYSEKIFWMYDGEEKQVMLRCKHHMMENIIDAFGQDVTPGNITEDTFDVTVDVSVSNTFFSWALGYAGDMTIAGPEEVKQQYVSLLKREIEKTER